jgi:hypothetical protein
VHDVLRHLDEEENSLRRVCASAPVCSARSFTASAMAAMMVCEK